MIKKLILLILALLSINLVHAQNRIQESIYFDSDKHQLSDSATKQLNELIERIKQLKVTQIILTGHTDSDGQAAYNEKLAENRVSEVTGYLAVNGIKRDLLKTTHNGERDPLTSNTSDNGKQKNRRVDIIVMYEPVIVTSVKKDTLPAKPASVIQKVKDDFTQSFTVSTNNDIIIKGEKGTEIKIYKNSLVDGRGNRIRGDVVVELKEIVSKSDMVLNGIQTVANGQLLESDGMVFIKITSRNKEVFLSTKPYKTDYIITLPTEKRMSGMSVFYGDSVHGSDNWHKAKNIRNSIGDFHLQPDSMTQYIFPADKFGWINCDRFTNISNKTDLNIILTSSDSADVCLVFKTIKSVMNIREIGKKGMGFSNVPVGYVATLVAYAKKGSEVLYYSKEIKIETQQKEEISLEKISKEEFERRIKLLD